MDSEVLLLLIRSKLADGRLPQHRPTRVAGGPGKSGVCEVCDEKIAKDELTIESLFLDGRKQATMHVQCFWAWVSEVKALSQN